MPIHAPQQTLAALGGGLLPHCDSRSLFQDRFADPQATDKTSPTRKAWFDSLTGTARKIPTPLPSLTWLPEKAAQLHARLVGRLMVNMAGGVMENAGLLLDRYGLPVIPGSAVKACARRMALQALHDWIAAGTERPSSDDACRFCCEGFNTPAEMLAAIALVFGWVEQDWSAGKNKEKRGGQTIETTWKSDFAWACTPPPADSAASIPTAPTGREMTARGNAPGDENLESSSPDGATQLAAWHTMRDTVTRTLCAHLAIPLKPDDKHCEKLPNFAGTIAFLPARPNADPGLELDVVTPHHGEYYRSTNPNAVATDTENPVPVFFPAVKPQEAGAHFTFPILQLRGISKNAQHYARTWLANGLKTFGLGAKTNAGYGWFQDVTEEVESKKALSARLRHLEAEFGEFSQWPDDRKDEAILALSERSEDCRFWQSFSPNSFANILAYANAQDLPLL